MNSKTSISAGILCGGQSSRMGADKAFLKLNGKSLLQLQADKLREMGIDDIIISGPARYRLPGTRLVQDVYENCGPISGLHSCLSAASCSACLILGVDSPFLGAELLTELCRSHSGGITMLSHKGKDEPLIAVYDRSLSPLFEQLIKEGKYSVRSIFHYVQPKRLAYEGDELQLCNCNTPEDFLKAKQIMEQRT